MSFDHSTHHCNKARHSYSTLPNTKNKLQKKKKNDVCVFSIKIPCSTLTLHAAQNGSQTLPASMSVAMIAPRPSTWEDRPWWWSKGKTSYRWEKDPADAGKWRSRSRAKSLSNRQSVGSPKRYLPEALTQRCCEDPA